MQIETLIQHIERELPLIARSLSEHHQQRAAERKQMLAAFKRSELSRLRESDDKLKQEIDAAVAALKQEEKQEREAEKLLQGASEAALENLRKLRERWSGR